MQAAPVSRRDRGSPRRAGDAAAGVRAGATWALALMLAWFVTAGTRAGAQGAAPAGAAQGGAATAGGAAPAAAPGTPAGQATDPDSPRQLSAVVMQVKGRVRARSSADEPWRPVAVNDILKAGAQVQTGLNSIVAMRVGRNATILMDPGSDLILPELSQDAGALKTRAVIRSGRADFKVDRVGLDNDFKIMTPSSTIAVRGTGLGVASGKLRGTEVLGLRTNLVNSIEIQWIRQNLQFLFGHGRSTSRLPDPALDGLDATTRGNATPGLVSDESQLRQLWANGILQNVQFNVNQVQQVENATTVDEADELAVRYFALQELAMIRAAVLAEGASAQQAVLLAGIFSQQAVALSQCAIASIPGVSGIIAAQTPIAAKAAMEAESWAYAAADAEKNALGQRDDALQALQDTVVAVANEDYKLAQQYADAASLAASFAIQFAREANDAAGSSISAATQAGQAAAVAQVAINQYFDKVSQIESLAQATGAQASIAKNAAQTLQQLQQLSQTLAQQNPGSAAAAGLVVLATAQLNQAVEAATKAAEFRDTAMQAAYDARSAGEKALFNSAAQFAAQAAASAIAAAQSAVNAEVAAKEALEASLLAQKLAGGGGGGGN